jgi:glycosyltransferase involved in cell wall biosynthesis
MLLSVIMPVYNERRTLAPVLLAVSRVLPTVPKEVIIVDDCSTDGTREWLKAAFPDGEQSVSGLELDGSGNLVLVPPTGAVMTTLRPIYHERNKGKGGGLQTGFAKVSGDIVVIQDADLEYDPQDWTSMYDLIAVRKVADVVYGSRFYGQPHRSLSFHHYLGNRVITLIFDVLFNQYLTDVQTCYKMMTRAVVDSLRLTLNDFGIDIEISAQIARQRQLRIYELAITYYGRGYAEGKKITWKDGVKGLWYLVKFRLLPP